MLLQTKVAPQPFHFTRSDHRRTLGRPIQRDERYLSKNSFYSSFNPNVAFNADFPAVQNTVPDVTPGQSLL